MARNSGFREARGDLRLENVTKSFADFTAVDAARYALVVFSSGFAPEHPWLVAARAVGCTYLGELDFAAPFWPGRIVAI